jgi:hypothetical protein
MRKQDKRGSLLIAGILSLGLFLSSEQRGLAATNTRVSSPTAFLVELAGRGLLYSVNIDRVLSDDFSAGFGIGSVTMNDLNGVSANISATMIPAYVNYYLMRDAGSVFVTGGINLVTNANTVKDLKSNAGNLEFSSTPIHFNAGVGYEYRSDAGYLMRVTGYALYGGKKIAPWAGVALGYSF